MTVDIARPRRPSRPAFGAFPAPEEPAHGDGGMEGGGHSQSDATVVVDRLCFGDHAQPLSGQMLPRRTDPMIGFSDEDEIARAEELAA